MSRNAPLLAGGGPLQAASPELLFVTGGCDGGGDTTDTAPKVSPAQPSPATDCSYTSLSQPDTCRGTPPGDTQYPLYPFHSYNTLNLLDIISLDLIPTPTTY